MSRSAIQLTINNISKESALPSRRHHSILKTEGKNSSKTYVTRKFHPRTGHEGPDGD